MHKLIRKITANNGGVFTGNGTNTYLIGEEDITLIDPGPNNSEHIEKILLMGENKPLLPGIANAACLSLPIVF